MDNMTLDDYRKLVERVMQDSLVDTNSQTRVFTNSGAEHARIVFDTMVDHAQLSVFLYSREMSTDAWDSRRVRSFLERAPDAKVHALLDNKDAASSPTSALSALKDFVANGRVVLRHLSEVDAAGLPHVAISDGKNVRIERDAKERKAVVGFGHHGMAEAVSELYETLWSKGAPVSINLLESLSLHLISVASLGHTYSVCNARQ